MDEVPTPNTEPCAGPAQEHDATEYLRASTRGDDKAADRLLSIVYAELRHKAAEYLARERPGHTLQATALVHEAWFRLIDQERVEWRNEGHFLAIASQAMRRILVDHARTKHCAKRGGSYRRVEMSEIAEPNRDAGPELLTIDRGLEELRKHSERLAQVVELRFFGGVPMAKIAKLLGVSMSTLDREWRVARAWLEVYVMQNKEE